MILLVWTSLSLSSLLYSLGMMLPGHCALKEDESEQAHKEGLPFDQGQGASGAHQIARLWQYTRVLQLLSILVAG